MASTRWGLVAAAIVGLSSAACSSPEADRFLDSIKRADYDAAFTDLHTSARSTTPDAATLRAQFEAGGFEIASFSVTCSHSDTSDRKYRGYDIATRARSGMKPRGVAVGGANLTKRHCSGQLVLALERDTSVPGKPWKVSGLRINAEP